MATEFKDVEARLWKVADSLRANSGLKASEYSTPVLGLIFLKYWTSPGVVGKPGYDLSLGGGP